MDFSQQEQNCTDWELTIHEKVVQYNKGLKSAFAQHFVFTYQNLEKFRSPLVPPSGRSIGRKKPVFMGILIGEVCGLQNRHSPVQIWSSPPAIPDHESGRESLFFTLLRRKTGVYSDIFQQILPRSLKLKNILVQAIDLCDFVSIIYIEMCIIPCG